MRPVSVSILDSDGSVTCFRAMTVDDIPEVMEIDESSYEFPWTEGIFRDCLRVGYQCYVIENEGRVVAYAVLSLGVGEAHILNLCVAESCRGIGLGRQFLQHLLNISQQNAIATVMLEVRPSNIAAVKLYESMGFNEIGIRKSYYPAKLGREDALILALELGLS